MNHVKLISIAILLIQGCFLYAVEQQDVAVQIQECLKNNDYSSAKKLFNSTQDGIKELSLDKQIAILNSLGILASRLFYEHDALEYYKAGLRLVGKTDDVDQLSVLVENIAALYVRLGDVANASAYLKMGELLYKKQRKPLPFSLLNNLGTNEFYKDEVDKALEYHKIASQRLYNAYRNLIPKEYYGVFYNLAWDYLAKGEFENALKSLQECRIEETTDYDLESRLLYVKACAGGNNEILDDAAALLKHGISTSASSFVNLALAESSRQKGQWENYAVHLKSAFNATLDNAFISDVTSGLPPQFKSLQRRCLLVADALCRAGKTKEAWAWIQRANTTVENELLANGSHADLGNIISLEKQLIVRRSQNNHDSNNAADNGSNNIIELEQNYEEAKKNLRLSNPALWERLFSERVNVHPDDLDQIRHILPEDTILLEVAVLDSQLAIFVCSAKRSVVLKTVQIKNADKRIRMLVMQYRQAMSSAGELVNAQNIGKKLYDALLLPIQSELRELAPKTIIFSPAGILRYVSLATLFDGEQFLVQRYTTANLSGYDLIRIGSHEQIDGKNINFIGFSNPDGTLPASDMECLEISRQFAKSTVFSQHKATLKQFFALSGSAAFVHIATHGVLNAEHPDESYLVFADDKLQYKNMIAGIPMMNNLGMLTLSSCNTANVNPSLMNNNALEIYGIAYQFVRKTHSGATLATLWPVSDEHTRKLMTVFYESMLRNVRESSQWHRAESLVLAQRQILASPESRHPFFWGAFILIGNYK